MGILDFSLGEIGGLFTSAREAITGKKIEDPQRVLDNLAKLEQATLSARAQVVTAEANSEHIITSTWRPITMLVFVFIIANNYIIVPYMTYFGWKIPTLELTDQIWDLLKLGLTGYIVGRSLEKGVKTWKGK